MRSWLGCASLASLASLAVVAAGPSVAHAELGGGKLKVEIKIPQDAIADAASIEPGDFIDGNADQDLRYFNLARCVCDDGGNDQNFQARISWETQPTMPVTGQLYVWTGSGCETTTTPAERDARCTQLDVINDVNDVTRVIDRFESVRRLTTPAGTSTTCDPDVTASAYGIYSSTDGGTTLTPELVTKVEPIDMRAPEMPELVTVNAQEGQITVGWDEITTNVEDYEYFQALCAVADTGQKAHDDPTNEIQFDTTERVCEVNVGEFEAAAIDNVGDVVGTDIDYASLPAGLAQLQEAFICGQSNFGRSITLQRLQNGVAYMVVVVAMDKAGNYTARYVPGTVTPQPVTDFWEDLNEEEDGIEGGLCLVESTYGGGDGGLNGALRAWRDDLQETAFGRWMVERYYAWGAPLAAAARSSVVARVVIGALMLPLVAVALVWHALGLPVLLALVLGFVALRRRRRWIVAGAIALAPSLAAAQGSMSPYWDDELATESAETTGPSWHFGLRLGPYLPEIDDDRFASPGPYERMFGDGSWLPALDLHRVWNTRFGQIGGGVSLAYFSKTADAYKAGSDRMDDPRERADGNENTLTIVPTQLTAIWRGTMLHDTWGIPIVPYARGGLGYYLWWVRRPDGEYAKWCTSTPCDRAIGASLGLVGAAGLSIRAEGIDPDAARSMRDTGLDHAGFYAEVEMAWVDGFGSAKKLSVGDTTWSAGIDFEF